MELCIREKNAVVIIDIKGDIKRPEASSGTSLHLLVADQLQKGKRNILLNFQGVGFIDSYGVGEIVASYVLAINKGAKLKVTNMPKKFAMIFQVTMLSKVPDMFDTEEAALESFYEAVWTMDGAQADTWECILSEKELTLASPHQQKQEVPPLADRKPFSVRRKHVPTSKSDPVACTVFTQPSAPAGSDVLVQIFAHLPERAEEAEQLAMEFDSETRRRGFQRLEARIDRGTRIVFSLSVPQLTVKDPVRELVWDGHTKSVQFDVGIPENKRPGTVIGTVIISHNSVPVGHIKFKLTIIRAGEPKFQPQIEPAGDEARWYKEAFISYASEDRDKVFKRVQMLNVLKIGFFQDLLSLEPGAHWERELYRHIDLCDLFLLFWSSAAKGSEWVMREVNYALKRQADNEFGSPEILPIILEGPPIPEPPENLRHLQFSDKLIYFMDR